MDLNEARAAAKAVLESLITQCHKELANLQRFDDERMLIATGDLQFALGRVEDAAEVLAEEFEAAQSAEED